MSQSVISRSLPSALAHYRVHCTVSTTGSRSPLSRPEPARASHPVRLRDRHAASKSQFWSSSRSVAVPPPAVFRGLAARQ